MYAGYRSIAVITVPDALDPYLFPMWPGLGVIFSEGVLGIGLYNIGRK